LQDFGMTRVGLDNAFISVFGLHVILLLLKDMPNLEPNIRMSEWTWRIAKDVVEAIQRLLELALLFVDYPKTEKNLVLFVKFQIFAHAEDRGECLFGMVEGAISVVENADSIPKLWVLLWVWKEIKRLLVC
jgi:hypothetical protein